MTANFSQLVRSGKLLPLNSYDHIIVSFSGGKDSMTMILWLLEQGYPINQIELWHQDVDGGKLLFDWPCTPSYCKAVANHLGVRLLMQWRDGGLEREMCRDNQRTAGVYFQDPDGNFLETKYVPPAKRGRPNTRQVYPQQSADLSVRWCSSSAKIDVARRAINNSTRFLGKNILFVTGERREESSARAKYNELPPHGSCNGKRHVDHWRLILDWPQDDVWSIIRNARIMPHPAYRMGYGRVSCMNCIFMDNDQAASNSKLLPVIYGRHAEYEARWGKTIHRGGKTLLQRAAAGDAFAMEAAEEIRRLSVSNSYPLEAITLKPDEEWWLPERTYSDNCGPS